jgi:hypothetical protein
VSETSLRRWTNAGRLPCFRIGGKRERRFRRADLLAFLESERGTVAGHLCGLYSSDAARAQQAVGFLADGLRNGSTCFLVAETDVRARIVALLERRRRSLPGDIEAGRLVLSEYADSATAQLEFWTTRLAGAARAGARSLRVLGDVSGGSLGRRNALQAVLQYEADYDRSIARRFPVATLCLYDARLLSGVDTSQVLAHHGDAFHGPAS